MIPANLHVVMPVRPVPVDLAGAIGDALSLVDERLTRATTALAPALRDRLRSDGGWSVHQILEHVARTNEGYLPGMQALARRLTPHGAQRIRWQPTFMGRMLATSLAMRIPLPAPTRIAPGPHPRANALDAVIDTHNTVRALMTDVAHTDWRAERMVSPYARFARLNFGDACVVILRHAERHTGQLERLAQSLSGA